MRTLGRKVVPVPFTWRKWWFCLFIYFMCCGPASRCGQYWHHLLPSRSLVLASFSGIDPASGSAVDQQQWWQIPHKPAGVAMVGCHPSVHLFPFVILFLCFVFMLWGQSNFQVGGRGVLCTRYFWFLSVVSSLGVICKFLVNFWVWGYDGYACLYELGEHARFLSRWLPVNLFTCIYLTSM